MAGRRRRRLGGQEWGEVLKRFAGSGKTVGEFCEREGVAVSSFHRWRERLKDEAPAALVPAKRQAAVRKTTGRVTAMPFVDLGALGSTVGAGVHMHEGALDLRLDLGGGVSLHLVRR